MRQLFCETLFSMKSILRKVIPFIQPDYFDQRTEKIIFEEITQFIVNYGAAITVEALAIEMENRTDLSETEVKESREITAGLTDDPVDDQWLLDTTEKWCRDRAIYLALMNLSALLRAIVKTKEGMLFLVSFQMHWRSLLTTTLDTITYKTMRSVMSLTIKKGRSIPLTLNISTRSQKVVYQIRLLTSLLLVQASASLCSCATTLLPYSFQDVMFCTSRLKWA